MEWQDGVVFKLFHYMTLICFCTVLQILCLAIKSKSACSI